MSNHRYSSDSADKEVVLKSATFGLLAGFIVALPVAVTVVGTAIAGEIQRDDIRLAILFIPLIHFMVFIIVTVVIVCLYLIARGHSPPTPPAESAKKNVK